MQETIAATVTSAIRTKRHVAAAVVAGTCMLAAATSATAASAEAARVVEADRKIEATAFTADAGAGRAWVVATITRRFATGKEVRAPGARVPVSVDGLGYDAASRAIVYVDEGGTRSTCARVAGDEVTTTGACRIVATIEPRAIDSGHEIVARDHLVVRVVPVR